MPQGGPDGGDGGKGGDIWLTADRNVASLLAFRDHPHRKGESGTHGSGNKRHGHRGKDLVVAVPEGTTPADLITALRLPVALCALVLIDGVFIPPEARATRALVAGERFAIWPPVAGG